MQSSILVELKKIVLLAFVSVLLYGTILLVAVSVNGCLVGDYPPQWRNETEYAFLWVQPAVSGNDNWATATYKDGILYAPSKGNNKVWAINASNGDIIWYKVVRWSGTSPCIDGDVIYVGETYPYMDKPRAMALNRTTGEEIWSCVDLEPDDYAWMGCPVVYGDYVYYTTWGSVYALNKTNGNPIWHENNINLLVCCAAYHDGVVFVTALNPRGTYAFNATTGEIVWHARYGGSWDSSPVIYDGMVIQSMSKPIMRTCVLNETTGELIRKFPVGTLSTPLVHDGKIFIPGSRLMYAFDLMTGDELWRTVELHDGTYQNLSYCSPAGACGAIYYQSLNGTFYVIDEADGSILWSYALGSNGFGSPSIGDGHVFITNDAGLYAFKIGSGLGSGDWPMYCQNPRHISYSTAICPSAITCSISFAEVTMGESLTVSGTLSPARANHVVTITCTKPDGSTLRRTVTTRPDGSYSETITPDAAGSWDVQASWAGDMEYGGASSEATSFEVKPVEETPPPPPPWELYATVVVVTVAAIGVATIIYRRRRASMRARNNVEPV